MNEEVRHAPQDSGRGCELQHLPQDRAQPVGVHDPALAIMSSEAERLKEEIYRHIMEVLKAEHRRLDRDIMEAVTMADPDCVQRVYIYRPKPSFKMGSRVGDVVGYVASLLPKEQEW